VENKSVDKKFDMFMKFLDKALDMPEVFPEEVVFLPLTDEEWKSVFTERRIELVKTIIEKKPKSVNELVKLLKRHQEAVSRDLSYLERIGVVRIEKKGKNRIPSTNKKLIVVPLTIPVAARK
jgi:predicted transcriptional regulator